jgi:hypothetical protein
MAAFPSHVGDVLMGRTGTGPVDPDQPPFFPVTTTKFIVMSICTLSVYELYWFYKNWNLIKQREQTDIMPFWRAFFAYFFCYSCFSRIREHAESVGVGQSLAASPLAIGWIITSLLWRLPDPFWLVSMLAFLFMLPPVAAANRINAKVAPHHDPNGRFTAWNWVAVVVGGIFVVLAIIGSFD